MVHGDLAASNALADPDPNPGGGQVTALLDFEIAGADFRVQDFLVALHQSGALDAAQWQRRTAAFLRGHASVRQLTGAEVRALPELLLSRLETTMRWLAASGEDLVSLVGAQAGRPTRTGSQAGLYQDNPLIISKIRDSIFRPTSTLNVIWYAIGVDEECVATTFRIE